MKPSASTPWLMLGSRLASFIAIQSLFALGYYLAGSASAWEQGANWWPIVVFVANLVGIFLLTRLFRSEGCRYWDIFRLDRQHLKSDLLALLGLMVLLGPVSYLPNVLLGGLLFGSPEATLDLIVRPLPMWGVVASILVFPITQGLVELPTYFLYVLPRLKARGMAAWLAVTVASLGLAVQHVGVPLLLDWRFITWRALMFIPFALLSGIVLNWRPRLMPYMAVIHFLMDLGFAFMFLPAAI